jgi:DNA repair exonuclease SbcCD ATPase subunit
LDRWIEDVEKLKEDLDTIAEEKQSCSEIVDRVEALQSELKDLDYDCRAMLERVETNKEAEKQGKRLVDSLKQEIGRKKDTEKKLTAEMEDKYKGIDEKISELTELVESMQSDLGSAEQESKGLALEITENLENRKTLTDKRKQAKVLSSRLSALELLKSAWNRYGIPLVLVKNLYASIEEKASKVYKEFDNGVILVREVEDRGKPGVEFILSDRKGERSFSQLSAGEKVMFFISVRVAIAQIVSATRDVKAGFLILDEAMGNLSPKRRDDLMRLVNKILRRMFPQVVMVSHTEMRDIFDRTVRVEAVNDVSEVSVA